MWDSGRVESDQSVHVVYAGTPLKSQQRYFWKVRVWDQDGQPTPYSEPAWWEMGLLHPTDWSAQWIAIPAADGETETVPSLCFRKNFALKGKIARARAYTSGLGCYQLSINGQRIGNDVFAPGWTHYPKRVQYQTYDVTDALRQGNNAVGMLLGRGWWASGLGWDKSDTYARGNLRCLVQLEIEYEDSTHETVVSDDSWQAHESSITRGTFYHGETYDARRDMPGWNTPGFADTGWTPATVATPPPSELLVSEVCEPIRLTQELAAGSITYPTPGAAVFDFGQNLVGWVRLKVRGPTGTKITLRFAEVLRNDGTLYRDNYRSAQAYDEYILKGEGEEVWQPRFTYRGFRYVEVTGWPGEPPHDALTACAVHTDAPLAGSFCCSAELLNRINRNILWGQRGNMHSVPTDCPQRDERLGWMGDAQIFAPTSCWNMQMERFYTKWMHDIVDSQDADGHVKNVSPVVVVREPASPGWGDAVMVIPWTVYQFYGDTRIIEQNYEPMKKWIEYMRANASNNIYDFTHRGGGFGDWVAPAASPKAPIACAYYFYSTKLLSQMAAAIGRKTDAREYAELAAAIADAFNETYLNAENNQYPENTQTAYVLPLAFGIVPAERREAVIANLVEAVHTRDWHLSTGFLGTGYLLPVLTGTGHHDVAWRVATQRTWPSWGYMVEQGGTTIWEHWNSNEIDKVSPGMNSFNHFCFGAIGRWFYESLAGINLDPEHPGFKQFVIHPQPVDGLDWVRAEYPSLYGHIRSAWHKTDGGLALDVTVPPNTTARVYVPVTDKMVTVSEGETVVFRAGSAAGSTTGVRLLGCSDDAVVFSVGAGRYHFVAESN